MTGDHGQGLSTVRDTGAVTGERVEGSSGSVDTPASVSSPAFDRGDSINVWPIPSQVQTARRHAAKVLMSWGLDAVVETAVLIVSELVTNAVEAMADMDPKSIIVLRLLASDELLMIEVWDGSLALPERQDVTDDDLSGRGLIIVEALSSEVGSRYGDEGGKVVWAALMATP